jgi:cytidylate kinase
MKKVIAIDGPSGAGKSTVAKHLAKKLGFNYLDTGALYRAVALNLVRLGIDEGDSDSEILSALQKTNVKFAGGHIYLNDRDVSEEIRSADAGHLASVYSARKPVREYLMNIQRKAAENNEVVAEGRDMTTVVFPNAYKKFYLDASVEERSERRSRELAAKGLTVVGNMIRKEIIERDLRDSRRDIAPLKKAADAHIIDSTDLSIEEVLEKMLEIIGTKN